MRLAGAVAVALTVSAGLAQAQSPDALAWLQKIQDATRKLSYTGTFVYQHGGRSETSRITRYVDATGDIEKLEVSRSSGAPSAISPRCFPTG